MGENTKIEWCDHSWSPWRGCTKVSPGCANCYAETLSKRNPKVMGYWGKGKPRVLAKNWKQPLKWNQEVEEWNQMEAAIGKGPVVRTVFPSLCDWLDDEVPVEWLARFLALTHHTPNLRWLLLTKRPENWRKRIEAASDYCVEGGRVGCDSKGEYLESWLDCIDMPERGAYPENIWVGTSVEDQERTSRINDLLDIPAAGRFLSVEPLLGPVDIMPWIGDNEDAPMDWGTLDWVIIGGESGPGARPCNVEWVGSLVKQCWITGTKCFVKQLGSNACNSELTSDEFAPYMGRIILNHPKGGDPAEWPEDLRVRQLPWGGGR